MLLSKCAVFNSIKSKFIKKEAEGHRMITVSKILVPPLAVLDVTGKI